MEQKLTYEKEVKFNDSLPRNWTFLHDDYTHFKSVFGKPKYQSPSKPRFETRIN